MGNLAIRIDHRGSTAVPGLAAKPVIDIQISVADLRQLYDYTARLARLGYVHVPHPDAFCPFFHRPAAWPHTHHVHLVQSGGAEEGQTLAFRDYLREHPGAARAYERLKRELAPLHSAATFDSRQAYADAKTEFVTRITEQALAEGLPR
jgi:GrpB-like predicted nucleotidyltransferase (UPF0157 family)